MYHPPADRETFIAKSIPMNQVVAGREVRRERDGSASVWWCDCFGVCGPLVAAMGGPMGHEKHGD